MYDEEALRRLVSRVRHPPGEERPPGTTDDQLDDFEKRTGLILPSELRSWLKLTNGPCIGPAGIFGIKTRRWHLDMEYIFSFRPEWRETGWIPIASDGCGNYYLVVTKGDFGAGAPVVFLDTMDISARPTYIVASSVGAFLQFLLEDELGETRWPFDKEEVTTRDPEITSFRGVRLPWEAD